MFRPALSGPIFLMVLGVTSAACTKHPTNFELDAKVQPVTDAALATYAAIEAGLKTWPTPEPGAECVHLGLVPVPPFRGPKRELDDKRFGPVGPEPDTELVDAGRIPSVMQPPQNGVFESNGALDTVAQTARVQQRDKLRPEHHVADAQSYLAPYEAAAKVRYVIVARPNRYVGIPNRLDVFLFDRTKASLECSFAVDTSATHKATNRTGYDPYTGEVTSYKTVSGLKPAFARELVVRFGITMPAKEKIVVPAADDPKVQARAEAIVKALDAIPKDLQTCGATDLEGGPRLGTKALRIIARGALLDSRDSNVQTNPNVSEVVTSYLRGRDAASAKTLSEAAKWRVVEILTGGPAVAVDGGSFVGGGITGREVVFDAASHAVCQRAFELKPQETMKAKVRVHANTIETDIRELSAADLRKRIDEALGAP